jgi:hypothetical protein
MPLEDYRQAVERLCADAGISDVPEMLHDGAFRCAGNAMRIEYVAATDQCQILADLGPIEPADLPQVQTAMLEANFDNAADGLPVFGIHPDTGRAVLMMAIPAADALADGILRLLQERVLPWIDQWAGAFDDSFDNAVAIPA